MWEDSREERTLYTVVFVCTEISGGWGSINVAALEGMSETEVEEGRDFIIIPYSLLDLVPFAHNSCSKTST